MRAGASVALSGWAGSASAVAFDPVVRPFVLAFAAWLVDHGIPAGDPSFERGLTGLVVALGGLLGAGLRMWFLPAVVARLDRGGSSVTPTYTMTVSGVADGAPVTGSAGPLGLGVVLLSAALAFGVGCAPGRTSAPVVAPEARALLDADRQSFALAEVARLVDGLSRTHIGLEAEGRIAPADDLALSLSLAYVARQVRAAVEDLNETGKAAAIRVRDLDAALAALWAWLLDRVSPLPDGAARAELKAEGGPLLSLLEALRLEVTW